MPHLLNFLEVQRHGALELAHAADRAHRRRQPDDLHRPVRRPARPAGHELVQDLQPRRHDRPGDLVRLLDRAGRRHRRRRRRPATTRRRRWSTRDTVPAERRAGPSQTPAPWVPFTRAGCTVGDFSTANMVLENAGVDLPTVFGAELAGGRAGQRRPGLVQGSPRSPTTSAWRSTARKGDAICANAQAVKFGQTHAVARPPSPTCCPTEPGGYTGYQALFGAQVHRAAARRGHAEPDAQRLPGHRRRRATSSTSTGTQINEPFIDRTSRLPRASARPRRRRSPTSPTCRRPASRSPTATSPTCTSARPAPAGCTTATATGSRQAARPGRRLLRRRTPRPTTHAFADVLRAARRRRHHAGQHAVRDQRRGERPVRRRERRPGDRSRPRPAATASPSPCHYAARPDRRAAGQHQGPAVDDREQRHRSSTSSRRAPRSTCTASRPPTTRRVRQLERDTAAMTGNNPYSGVNGEKIVELPGRRARAADPAHADRRPAADADVHDVPDARLLLLHRRAPNVGINPGFAWDHGYYSPNIDITWAWLVGPGRGRATASTGRSRRPATRRTTRTRLNTVPEASTAGTWVEETDLRPTLLHLAV